MSQLTRDRSATETIAALNSASTGLRSIIYANLPESVKGKINRIQIAEDTDQVITETIENRTDLLAAWGWKINEKEDSPIRCRCVETPTTVYMRISTIVQKDNESDIIFTGGDLLLIVTMQKSDFSITFDKYWK